MENTSGHDSLTKRECVPKSGVAPRGHPGRRGEVTNQACVVDFAGGSVGAFGTVGVVDGARSTRGCLSRPRVLRGFRPNSMSFSLWEAIGGLERGAEAAPEIVAGTGEGLAVAVHLAAFGLEGLGAGVELLGLGDDRLRLAQCRSARCGMSARRGLRPGGDHLPPRDPFGDRS